VAVDVDGATIVSGHHELNCLILGDRDEARVMNHEEIPSALLEWFPVEVSVDVVLDLRPTGGVHVIRSGRRNVVDVIPDSLQPRLSLSSNRLSGERERYGRK
jgi:hypothetical protein